MIVVAGIVGGVAVVGTVVASAYEDYSDWSEHSDWSEISPEEKYKREIGELKYVIVELNEYIKQIIQEIYDELDIENINIPDLNDVLDVYVNDDGPYIVGCEEFFNLLKMEVNLEIASKLEEKFGEKIKKLKSEKKEILSLINRINKIVLLTKKM